MIKTIPLILSLVLIGAACANKNCREIRNDQEKTAAIASAGSPQNPQKNGSSNNSAIEDPAKDSKIGQRTHVKVFKYDGSKQCGMAEAIPLEKMQEDLRGIRVHKSWNLPDGLMHIQACGTVTGTANVYEIDQKDLPLAKKNGFKEWIY